jgi:hypothetical protein
MRRTPWPLALAFAGVVSVAVLAGPASADAGPRPVARQPAAGARVVIVVASDRVEDTLLPSGTDRKEPRDRLLRRYAALGLRPALLSTTQGEYSQRQSLLDITQGTRQPQAIYDRTLGRTAIAEGPTGWRIEGWDDVRRRAREASTTIRPGLLASTVGGATFVASESGSRAAGLVAADELGQVARVSIGTDRTVVDRYRAAADAGARLLVVSQPTGREGEAALAAIVSTAGPETLVIAAHLPPTPLESPPVPKPGARFYLQTAVAVGRATAPDDALRSASTRRPGLVVAIDIAPTALEHLGLPEPASMRGHPVEDAHLGVDRMEELRRRWSLVRSGRQVRAAQMIALLSLAVVVVTGFFRELRDALRTGARTLGLAFMALPAAAVLVAPLGLDAAPTEALVIALVALVPAVLLDRLVRWPLAPLAPAFASLAVVTIDLARGGGALAASIIGPSVSSGNRFYGISNELEPVLPSLMLTAIAAAFSVSRREGGRRLVTLSAYGVGGVVLAAVVSSGLLGADVGGIVTIAGAFAVAALVGSGATLSVRRVAVTVVGASAAGLLLLVAADRVAGADSHLANNLRRLQSPQELFELFARRYQLSVHVAAQPAQLVALAVALVACLFVYRHRATLIGEIPTRPWRAALLGTLAGGLAGALSNDSGPVLFVNAVVAAAAIVLYLGGGAPARNALVLAPRPSEERAVAS